MHGNACTRHVHNGPQDYRQGRCRACRNEANRRYAKACRDARCQLVAVQAALAV